MSCTRTFDEELLSGYLDRSLPQKQSQRVRLHLEDCPSCRALYEQLQLLQEAARSSEFVVPAEDAWPEAPRSLPSRWSRSLGWALIVPWVAISALIALWRFLQSAGDALEIFLGLGFVGGFLLLFLSVLLDRLQELKTDRYRGVHR